MATDSGKRTGPAGREVVPFTVRTADGATVELDYSSPRAADDARRARRARDAAVVRAGQAAAQLHAPRDRLLRRGRADLGQALGRGGNRDAARGARLAADRERDPSGVRAGVAVLLLERGRQRRPRQAAGAVRRVLRGARRQRRARQLHRAAGARDRRLRLHQEPRDARRRRARRARRRDSAPLRPRLMAEGPRSHLEEGPRGAPGARSTSRSTARASASPEPAAGSTRRRSYSTSPSSRTRKG